MSISSISMSGIAQLAGVSQPTVSYVLNDRWRAKRISPEMAAKVRRIARENNYRPNRLVHALQTGHSHTLAVILPTVSVEYFPRIAIAIENEAKQHGYHILISHIEREEDEIGEIDVLLEHRVDGLIVVPRHLLKHRDNYRRLIAHGVPLVFVDSYYPDVPCPAVVSEDEAGMCALTQHLLARGHRRIAYLDAGFADMPHVIDRRRGFVKAMLEHGLAIPPAYMIDGAEEVSAAMTRLCHLSPRPTAVAVGNDYMAAAALVATEALGLRIPEDVAMTGFGDCLANVNLHRVPLTSVQVDLDAMGRLAMQRLLGEIQNVSNRHEVTRVSARVVERASSAGVRE